MVRAPVSDFRPEKWMKFFQGKWDHPGLGGDATALDWGKGASASVALWTTTGQILGVDWRQGGISLGFSTDRVTFTTLPEPLVPFDEGRAWIRPAPVELDAYYALIDAKTGTNQLSNSWMLTYLYIQPNEGLDKRYLVFRPVDVAVLSSPVSPQVGVELGRWYNAALHDRWSTTAPVPGNYTSYKLENKSGYLMTAASTAQPAVQLEECLSKWPGSRDHMIEAKGVCEQHGYGKLRLAGWAYSKPQAGTVPLYSCYDSQWHTHFVSNAPDCEKLGTPERLLGYALSQ